MTNYPGEPPHPSEGEPNQAQPADTPQDGPATGSGEGQPAGQSDTEPTQPVGYWERQAAEQAPAQESQQPWARPDPTTAYPSQPYAPPQQPYQQQPYQQPYADQQYGRPPGYPPAAGQSGPPPGAPPGYSPYGAFTAPTRDHPQATTALVLGIVGLVGGLTCGLGFFVSPFAWALGRNATKEIQASRGQLGGDGQARAGLIMGIIGTVLLVIGLLVVVLVIVLAIVGSSSTSGSSV
jgi:hypothetical protein